jgi:hypothetical protein
MAFALARPGERHARVLAQTRGRSLGLRALQSLTLRHCGLPSKGALRLRPNRWL